jgi:hypothetical protein
MPSSDWFAPLLVKFGLAILGLVLAGAAVAITITSLRRLRREMVARHAEMARHLRMIESRLDRLESHLKPSVSGNARKGAAGRSLPKAWRKESPSAIPGGPSRPEPRTSRTLIAVPALAAPLSEPQDVAESGLGERHAEILALAASGSSPGEIARQTGQPIGQVELILGLYRQLLSSRGPADHARAL